MRWYVSKGGETVGPVEGATVEQWAKEGGLLAGMYIRDEASSGWVPVEQSPFAPLVKSQAKPAEPIEVAQPVATSAPISKTTIIGLVAGGFVLLSLIGWCATPKRHTQTPSGVTAFKPPTFDPVPQKPREITLADQLASATELGPAVGLLRHRFTDTVNELDPAAALLATWGSQKMKWAELNALPEVSRAVVMKDSEAARGKRLCASGSITEIATDRSVGKPIYTGGLMSSGYNVVRFAAVGSSGDLVENSYARICGVVTGKQSYSNAGGGTTHAVYVVGMFDLPQNKAATAPAPRPAQQRAPRIELEEEEQAPAEPASPAADWAK